MYKEEQRCTGGCCKNFSFHVSPMEFKFWGKVSNLSRKTQKWIDTRKVADMIIFLYSDKQVVNGAKDVPKNKSDETRYHYTCKHFDKESNNCKIYEDRPQLCRDFNSRGDQCNYKNCTCVVKYEVGELELVKLA